MLFRIQILLSFKITVLVRYERFWFGMVLVGHTFINCLASESFVVSFSQETENIMEVSTFVKQINQQFSCIMYCYTYRQLS